MFSMEVCPECLVPRYITREHLWLDSGVIVQKNDPAHRLVLIDTQNLDPLYKGIGELIGIPIERIVTETARRTTRAYMDKLFPEELKEAARHSFEDLMGLVEMGFQVGRLLGCGNARLSEMSIKGEADDFVTIEVTEPYSAPLYFGNFAGTAEVVLGEDSGVTYREIGAGIYEASVFRADHPAEMRERLTAKRYSYEAGGVPLEKCSTCGGPKDLADYDWNMETGIIKTRASGQRVALLGTEMLDPVFTELENELGEAIPHLVIEAQRRYMRTNAHIPSGMEREEGTRLFLALRGLGDLQEFSLSEKALKVRLTNACCHLLVTGLAQGLFEIFFSRDSRLLWDLSDDGTLEIELEVI